ncbi:MAG: metal-sensitive transcriptional regulator [SAR324 cluster bacterium]|nr:metal-sensitive transcriptional regulator [SAR324 cluster bacterium]
MHPSHEDQISRINKIEGQVKGIRKMIEDQRYCIDIVSQIRAPIAALKKVEKNVLEKHLQHCVKEAMENKNPFELQEKISEIMQVISKMS